MSMVGGPIGRLRAHPRAALGRWPTPVEQVSGRFGDVWVKRDDLCGWGRGGSKARKIEHLVAHLEAQGYDEVVALVGNVSNLVYDLLPALDDRGIGSQVIVADYPPVAPAERRAIFHSVLGRIRLASRAWPAAAATALAAWIASRHRGHRPFLLLPGGAHPAAVVGNACGLIELADQFDALGMPPPAALFVTVATGTTLAGFVLAARALVCNGRLPIRVMGVKVDRAPVRYTTTRLLRWTESRLGLRGMYSTTARLPQIEILGLPKDGEFGRFGAEDLDVCRRVRDTHGLALDPIFGGKTWLVMERMLSEDAALRGRPVVYWHCGYTPEWRELGVAISRSGAA